MGQSVAGSGQTMTKNMIFGSMGVAGLVALLAILDLALGFPFGGEGWQRMTMDILFLVASAIVLYLGWDAYRENK